MVYLCRMPNLHRAFTAEALDTTTPSLVTPPSRVAVAVEAERRARDANRAAQQALCGRAHFAPANGQRDQLLQQLRTLGVLP